MFILVKLILVLTSAFIPAQNAGPVIFQTIIRAEASFVSDAPL